MTKFQKTIQYEVKPNLPIDIELNYFGTDINVIKTIFNLNSDNIFDYQNYLKESDVNIRFKYQNLLYIIPPNSGFNWNIPFDESQNSSDYEIKLDLDNLQQISKFPDGSFIKDIIIDEAYIDDKFYATYQYFVDYQDNQVGNLMMDISVDFNAEDVEFNTNDFINELYKTFNKQNVFLNHEIMAIDSDIYITITQHTSSIKNIHYDMKVWLNHYLNKRKK